MKGFRRRIAWLAILVLALVVMVQSGEATTIQSAKTGLMDSNDAPFTHLLAFDLDVGENVPLFSTVAYAQTEDPSCTDSDGGLDYEVAGYVEGVGPNGWSFTKYDACETGDYEGYLKEFYCNGTLPWPQRYQCPNGCADGACVPETCTDDDGDSYAIEGGGCGLIDCDDADPDVNPGAAEVCDNGIDDDCDGAVDGDDADCAVCTDADGDGYAVEGGACGLVDCDDTNDAVNPGTSEVCDNGIDDDCDGDVDDDDADCGGGPSCTDSDGGLFYEIAGYVEGEGANGWPFTKYDVCETSGTFEGQLREFYCNGTTPWPNFYACPNGCADGACVPETCTDDDGDGYAIEGGGCGIVDCDDSDASVNPGAVEVCDNGIDDNCDGLVDTADPACIVCTDADGDGYAVEGGACGLVDCDDSNGAVNPGASEVCDNGIDDNCNGFADAADPICSDTPNIIVVGWDGTQRDHFWQCYNKELPECPNGLPNIQSLSGGEIWDSTITNGSTSTKPGWAQIFTGYNWDVTGVWDLTYYQPIPEGYTVFEKIENHFGPENVITMFISAKGVHTGGACEDDPTTKNGQPVIEDRGQPWCLTKDHLDYFELDKLRNDALANRALELLEAHQNDQFFALFLFRDPDVTGHLSGEDSVAYSEKIIEVDQYLGNIMAKLQELGISERTLVYVVTDHGFDEGDDKHLNAPYGFLATNDPLVVRSGDRKDIGPTLLERYGISLGAIGGAPPVDGYSLFSIPNLACIPEGEAYVDYPGAPMCCSGLTLIDLDMQYSLGGDCRVPTGGSGDNSGYCTACGDGVCDQRGYPDYPDYIVSKGPENACNCPQDCSQ